MYKLVRTPPKKWATTCSKFCLALNIENPPNRPTKSIKKHTSDRNHAPYTIHDLRKGHRMVMLRDGARLTVGNATASIVQID